MQSKEKVFKVVSQIPIGKVSTYGRIAKSLNLHPRAVGVYLHQNTDSEKVPCHRVVNFQGKLASGYAFGGTKEQALRLKKEGININEAKVQLKEYLWRGL